MSSYRFCRSDDIGLLVDALNRCWAPYFPDEPLETTESFKRSIRTLQVWCSSCMVAFEGTDPIGVLIGAKRSSATLVYRIAVHPDHLRQGHARHMLTSLGSKLAILGPPRIVAEVPELQAPACALFAGGGYRDEAVLTNYVLTSGGNIAGPAEHGRFVIPVTMEDLSANGLLEDASHPTAWERSIETLIARKDEIRGLGVASDERIEAYVLYAARAESTEIVSCRSVVEDDGAVLAQLLVRLRAGRMNSVSFSRVHPAEVSKDQLVTLGFRPAAAHRLYTMTARANG